MRLAGKAMVTANSEANSFFELRHQGEQRRMELSLITLQQSGHSPFHPNAKAARIVGYEWRQEVRQQLLCAESVDYTSWASLCPAVVLFEVSPCPATLGCDVDNTVSVLQLSHSNKHSTILSAWVRIPFSISERLPTISISFQELRLPYYY